MHGRTGLLVASFVCVALLAAGTSVAWGQTPIYRYDVANTYPHDTSAFTQGLVLLDGKLYESTGLYGSSTLREVDLASGTVLRRVDVPPQYFAEGMTVFQGKIFQLTYQSQIGFVYDPATFNLLGQFAYTGEGWGLTHDAQHLIMSDGTSQIRFLNPVTFQVARTIAVHDDQGRPVININELEYIDGEIYANIWQTNWIARIDPVSGAVVAWIDLTGLLPAGTPANVLNGIAYDAVSGHLLVTGKFWPWLFEITLSPVDEATPPSVALTSPANGATFSVRSWVTLSANASDNDGISSVSFYANGALLGSDAASPYSVAWQPPSAGTYLLTATAIDNSTATATSSAVTITVTNAAPSVSLTSPAGGTTFTAPASVTLSANATDADGPIAKVDFFANGAMIGTDTTNPFGMAWTNVPAGNYLLTAVATDETGLTTASAGAAISVSPASSGGGTSAAFVRADTATQGNWRGVYGADGYAVLGDVTAYPTYATVQPANHAFWNWDPAPSSVRALQRAAGTGRIAATWYTGATLSIDVNFSDSASHQLAIYALDWDGGGRTQRIDVVDAVTGVVLDSRTQAAFTNGQYLVWTVKGHVRLDVTRTGGVNAVISGVFLDTPGGSAGGTSAAFVRADTATQGNWRGVYGADGHAVIGDVTAYPAYATVQPSGQALWTWDSAPSSVRALQRAAGTGRIAATWYTGATLSIDVNFSDSASHQLAIYALDWDGGGRTQRIDVVDAVTGVVLDSRTLAAFTNGQYLVWTVKGHVRLDVTRTGGVNAVISGVFLDTPGGSAGGTSAAFMRADTATQGNWRGVYGADGHAVIGDVTAYPAYATVQPSGQALWPWDSAPSSVRALQRAAGTGRIAATWYTGTTLSIDVSFSDSASHQLAIYALDWDGGGRTERVDVVDAVTGALLDTRTVTEFGGGQYLVWTVRGHVRLDLTRTGGVNAVNQRRLL